MSKCLLLSVGWQFSVSNIVFYRFKNASAERDEYQKLQ